jgi:hypothetical protein
MSTLKFNKIPTPNTPAENKVLLYAKGTSLYYMGEDGVEVRVATGADTPDVGAAVLAHPSSPYQSTTALTTSTFGTWINQDSASFTEVNGGLTLAHAKDSANELHIRYKSLSYSSNYRLTFMVIPTTWGQYNRVGIYLMRAAQSDRGVFFGYMHKADSPYFAVQKWTAATTFDGVYYEEYMGPSSVAPYWFRLVDDNTYWRWSISLDGNNFIEVGTTTRNDWFSGAADRVGLAIGEECSTGFDVVGYYRSYKEESL